MLRGQVADIVISSIFLFVGLSACFIAAIRGLSGTRVLVWLGMWSAMYGAIHLIEAPAILAASSGWIRARAPYAHTVMMYLLAVVGPLSFLELSAGRLRLIMRFIAWVGLAIAVAGIAYLAYTGPTETLMGYANVFTICILLTLAVVVAAPSLATKYLVLPERGVLGAGILVFVIEALYNSLTQPLGLRSFRILDHFGFATLLFSFGFVALRLVLTNERRLVSIENELAIAREIQTSILPDRVPEVAHLRISAAYRPMNAVAGDFYDFIRVDEKRLGVLVADVSGHGVPAALIASMIKVAMQSILPCAGDPRAVLCGLNRILSGQLRGQFVTAAYLWLDMSNRAASYSAAGHPPLLRWRDGGLERIESNGLLFGVRRECGEYPVYTTEIERGDRFLLYTDGITEPENADGECFDDGRLEEFLRQNHGCAAPELLEQLLSEIGRWQPTSVTQQDDMTLVVIDVV